LASIKSPWAQAARHPTRTFPKSKDDRLAFVNPDNPNAQDAPGLVQGAKAVGLQLEVLTATVDTELEPAFLTVVRHRDEVLMVMPDPFFINRRAQLVQLASHYGLPVIYPFSEYVKIGGLVSYGVHLSDLYHLLGTYAGKILQGVKPTDLPIVQSTHFELAINLNAARALGLTVPQSLLARADEVIE
jgi:ABC-type uncharacterized transport system substrate-binding protein